MSVAPNARPSPAFDFMEFFEGHTRASGWFTDRFGNLRRHFCGDFVGTRRGEQLLLDETLYYTDGIVEKRLWTVDVKTDGKFSATSEALIGPATGRIGGNTLSMQYTMKVLLAADRESNFSMDDLMIYQPDGSLHNMTHVKKWGIRIGTVSTQYFRHDGGDTCEAAISRVSPGGTRSELPNSVQ